MKTLPTIFAILFAGALLTVSSFAQQPATSPAAAAAATSSSPAAAPAGQPSAADMQQMMQQMMELTKLNENHKMLADLNGTWSYTVKMWMNPDPNAKPQE